jgi:hypothetical protein
MTEIKAKFLANTITLFNKFKDMDTGTMYYYRTELDNVRVDTSYSTYYINNIGSIRKKITTILIDKKNTIGWALNNNNNVVNKKEFMMSNEWENLSYLAKDNCWTIREKDWIYAIIGELKSICNNFDIEVDNDSNFIKQNKLHIISEIKPIIDKKGALVYWEINCD